MEKGTRMPSANWEPHSTKPSAMTKTTSPFGRLALPSNVGCMKDRSPPPAYIRRGTLLLHLHQQTYHVVSATSQTAALLHIGLGTKGALIRALMDSGRVDGRVQLVCKCGCVRLRCTRQRCGGIQLDARS
eukprot:5888908-Amphidinium_carterae.1